MELDFERCYRAVDSRDQRFDGWFYTGVTTTGIYCRPSCPATTPKRRNVRFYPSAAAAQRAGLRACRRCRPDAAPGSPEWNVRADLVGRAMRLIADGVVDREGVPGLAGRLGYTDRHLHRMLVAEVGAGPLALARAQRAQTARILVETTDLGLAEIAFAAGFGSVRQFNDTIREVYAVAPSQLRDAARRSAGTDSRRASRTVGGGDSGPTASAVPGGSNGTPGTIALRLAYRAPLHADALLDFLALRAVPGIEEVEAGSYRRGLRLPHGPAEIAMTPMPGYVAATLRLADVRDLAPAVARCRRLFDLDADPEAVDGVLGADPVFAETVAKEPGIRVPRAVDGFEMAVRAIVGQQVSVAGARTVLARLAAAVDTDAPAALARDAASALRDDRLGRTEAAAVPTDPAVKPAGSAETAGPAGLRAFPTAEEVLALPDSAFGMPAARRATIRALAEAAAAGDLDLDPGADRAELVDRLTALPGIGAWTAGYVAMRAIGDPDVFLPTDLGVRRGAAALGLPDDPKSLDAYAGRWRPWRSYAVIRLWRAE
ncbi:DNA-3-methyladenine glycosylase 2 family protein [Plantactinospora sp. KLBMP9567]|uniref:DNA-3-methyladenine glycosylase 2 family protein n=1 Tax=Plantactinospora sp. KLBMP9567 TaxID=3085900 RepID=UPI00298235A3|nr:AlkA N-terminal domain-containing protein [Plantactinospora sp. KLBMP9567]MDW5326293.1 AlkA N-terminal domain-containing protein [Plantactinospora sp. KLBMP9567]